MTLCFGALLDLVGIDRRLVRLLRHQENRHTGDASPYTLWRDERLRFEDYQSTQSIGDAAKLRAPIWASFVGLPVKQTLFVGLYSAEFEGLLQTDRPHAIVEKTIRAGSCDVYRLAKIDLLARYEGRLFVDWGPGYRAWIQRADSGEKPIVELRRECAEDSFPGYSKLVLALSEIGTVPAGWAVALAAVRGVYLLTCPRTREQYVGAAYGADGFLGRWKEYFATGHGGNIGLRSRDPSDYQVSILETVGSAATVSEVQALETLWKQKLQSREMGLNKN